MARAKSKAAPKARAKDPVKRTVRCYFCDREQEVSGRAMSASCPGCHKAIRIEDLNVNTYVPVNDLQTCGAINITKKGRVAAKRIKSGGDIRCEGIMHGALETPGGVRMGSKSEWKGDVLHSRSLEIAAGATLDGHIQVPWPPDERAR